MSLTQPVFLHPITIPTAYAGAGALLTLNAAPVTLAAGTYYWAETEGSAGSFNAALVTALNAAMAGTWTVRFGATFRLTIAYTGASTPTTLAFVAPTVLGLGMLGGAEDPESTSSASFTAKSWTGAWDCRWMWRPVEWVIDDRTMPRAAVVVARSPFDGTATIDDYGAWDERTLRLEGVRGAYVFDWAAGRSPFYVEAGSGSALVNNTLETFWRDARRLSSAPGTIRYLANGQDDFGAYEWEGLVWSDPEQLGNLAECLEELNPSPLLYTVTLRLLDTGVAS